jgi:hypothetical protein
MHTNRTSRFSILLLVSALQVFGKAQRDGRVFRTRRTLGDVRFAKCPASQSGTHHVVPLELQNRDAKRESVAFVFCMCQHGCREVWMSLDGLRTMHPSSTILYHCFVKPITFGLHQTLSVLTVDLG